MTMLAVSEATLKFISRRQLAARWGVSVRALLNWEKDKLLHPLRLGSAIRYAIDDIEALEATRK